MVQGVRYDNKMRWIAIGAFVCLFGPVRILIKLELFVQIKQFSITENYLFVVLLLLLWFPCQKLKVDIFFLHVQFFQLKLSRKINHYCQSFCGLDTRFNCTLFKFKQSSLIKW